MTKLEKLQFEKNKIQVMLDMVSKEPTGDLWESYHDIKSALIKCRNDLACEIIKRKDEATK